MRTTLLATAAATGYIFAAGFTMAAPADADPYGGQQADTVVNSLQGKGYDVQIQGDTEAPLSECTATQVSGLSGPGSTVYVTLSCDDDHDE